MLASEYITELQELIDTYGDRELWIGADDEGNTYVQPYSPGIGYVDNRYAEQHVLESGEITTVEDDIADMWREDLTDEEVAEIEDEGTKIEHVSPTKEQLKEYIDTNYKLVYVS